MDFRVEFKTPQRIDIPRGWYELLPAIQDGLAGVGRLAEPLQPRSGKFLPYADKNILFPIQMEFTTFGHTQVLTAFTAVVMRLEDRSPNWGDGPAETADLRHFRIELEGPPQALVSFTIKEIE